MSDQAMGGMAFEDIAFRPPTQLQQLQKRAWHTSEEHGFHALGQSFGDLIALLHSELSEALEDYRKNGPAAFEYRAEWDPKIGVYKPEGVPAEFADVLIRLLDACETLGIDLERVTQAKMNYNDLRPYRHGGKVL